MKNELVRLRINDKVYEVSVPPNKLLLDVLREDLGLTGSKRGCDDSSCGACTVLVNGEPQMSCLMLAVSYQGGEPSGLRREGEALPDQPECAITTIEGVAVPGVGGPELDPLQRGFAVEGGAQCGYCTPGMILTARSLLTKNPEPTEQEINQALSGNLCRCTGYTQILASVRKAIELWREKRPQEPVEVSKP